MFKRFLDWFRSHRVVCQHLDAREGQIMDICHHLHVHSEEEILEAIERLKNRAYWSMDDSLKCPKCGQRPNQIAWYCAETGPEAFCKCGWNTLLAPDEISTPNIQNTPKGMSLSGRLVDTDFSEVERRMADHYRRYYLSKNSAEKPEPTTPVHPEHQPPKEGDYW